MREKPRGSTLKPLILFLSVLLAWPVVGAEPQASLLIYQVESTQEPTHFNRLLATDDYLRLDRGAQDTGYILFDRREQVIYSVNHEDASILVIDPPPLSEPLRSVSPAVELVPAALAGAPPVGGVKPEQWVLQVDGAVCQSAVVLPGLMPGAVAAYGEYLGRLARQHALALPATPAEFQSACDNAVHVYASDRLLQKGLPLNLWDEQGYRESLVDFRQGFPLAGGEFTLPDGYTRSPMPTGL